MKIFLSYAVLILVYSFTFPQSMKYFHSYMVLPQFIRLIYPSRWIIFFCYTISSLYLFLICFSQWKSSQLHGAFWYRCCQLHSIVLIYSFNLPQSLKQFLTYAVLILVYPFNLPQSMKYFLIYTIFSRDNLLSCTVLYRFTYLFCLSRWNNSTTTQYCY